MKSYQSVAEILNDEEIPSVYHRGQIIDEFRRLHPEQPPAPPVPNEDEQRQLRELHASLTKARCEWLTLDAKEQKISVWLPEATEKLRTLEATTEPDAPGETIDEMNRLARRIQLARQFDVGISATRQAINNRVGGSFHALNKHIQKFNSERFPRQFFLAGTSPTTTINDALAVIDALLK